MERIGLTFDEFAELKLKPPAGADPAFHEAAAMERREIFPMNIAAASSHLRSRGYDCRPAMLELLVKDGIVKPASPDAWSQADVDVAADHFEQCQIFTPYAAACQRDLVLQLARRAVRHVQESQVVRLRGPRAPFDDV